MTGQRARTNLPVDEVRPGVWAVAVPMDGPLQAVYIYMLEAPNGLLLIDAGPPGEQALAAVVNGLDAIGASPGDVQGVLFTHTHIDHYGLASTLQELTRGWLGAHPRELDDLSTLAAYDARMLDLDLRAFGVSGGELESMLASLKPQADQIPALIAPDRTIADGQCFPLREGELVAMHTPGHAAGHLCFVHSTAGVLFSGDHVLSTTTPNVGLTSHQRSNPLAEYLESLRRVAVLDGLLSLPGHEQRVPVTPRAEALIDHHEARLIEAADAVRAGHSTVRNVAERMTWSLPWSEYRSLDHLLAMFEAFAHLVALEERGVLQRANDSPLSFVA